MTNIELRVKESDIGSNIDKIEKQTSDILNEMKTIGIFKEYTKHNIEHSREMLRICQWLIYDLDKLNQIELYLLVLGCYFHDIGMVVSEEEKQEILKSSNTNRFTEIPSFEIYQEELSEKQDEEKALENYVRKYHHIRSSDYIKKNGESKGIHKPLINVLANICKSHGEKELDRLETRLPFEYKNENYNINVQYVSILLRLSDILDLSDKRTPYHLYNHLKIKDETSLNEWRKHMGVNSICIRENNSQIIDISGETDNPEVYFNIERFKKWIYEEIRYCKKIMQEYDNDLSARYVLKVEDVLLEKYRTIGFEKETMEITVDTQKIIKLLIGENLYKDHTMATVRELILNSIDACRAYKKIESNYKPKIKIELNNENKKLIIDDNGIGMNEYIVKNFLLKAGSSYYSSDSIDEDLKDYSPYSKFGIGFLSSFLIANKVEVQTKYYNSNEVIRVIISDVSKKVLVEKTKNDFAKQGTIITLELKEKQLDIAKVVRYWVRHLEFDIEIIEGGSREIINDLGYDSKVEVRDAIMNEKIEIEEEKINLTEDVEGYLKVIFKGNDFFKEVYNTDDYKLNNVEYSLSQNGIYFTDRTPLPIYWDNGYFVYDINIVNKFKLNPELNRWNIIGDEEWNKLCYFVEEKIIDEFLNSVKKKGLLDDEKNHKKVLDSIFSLEGYNGGYISDIYYDRIFAKLKWIEYRGESIKLITLDELINLKKIEILPSLLDEYVSPFSLYNKEKDKNVVKKYKQYINNNAKGTCNIPKFIKYYSLILQYLSVKEVIINEKGLAIFRMVKLGAGKEETKNNLTEKINILPFYTSEGEINDEIFMTSIGKGIILNSNNSLVKDIMNLKSDNIKERIYKLIKKKFYYIIGFGFSIREANFFTSKLNDINKKDKLGLNIKLSMDNFLKYDFRDYKFNNVEDKWE